jgi:hypothetical protein
LILLMLVTLGLLLFQGSRELLVLLLLLLYMICYMVWPLVGSGRSCGPPGGRRLPGGLSGGCFVGLLLLGNYLKKI